MPIRVAIALLIVLSSRAQAARAPWHAAVAAPRPGLPAVTIDLGYPGPYVPAVNAPISLHATAADVPFDGYIGFHFGVKGRRTIDMAVVARAILRPRESWSFESMANLRKWGGSPESGVLQREVIVEWRDRSMRISGKESAGVPPWTTFNDQLLSLRVIAPSGQFNDSKVLGSAAYVERADALPDRAQWYAGFSSVVVPLGTWLRLSRRVREAIIGSGIHVIFVGLPASDSRPDDLDRVLLPVTFTARSGSYDAPWPYRGSRKTPISTPMFWRAKEGSDFVSSADCPYIARTNAATWVADEVALSRPLPAMTRIAGRHGFYFAAFRDDRRSLIAHLPWLLTGAALVISLVAWFLVRRQRRLAVACAMILMAGLLIAMRGRVRQTSGVFESVRRDPIAPGVVVRFQKRSVFGPTPLAEYADRSDRARTSLTGDYGSYHDAEVRRSETSPSMGLMHREADWSSLSRWTYRREIETSAVLPARTVLAEIYDFHGAMIFSSVQRPTSRDFRIEGRLTKEPDGRASCTFALGSTPLAPEQIAVLRVGDILPDTEAEISWGSGSIKLTPTKRDIYSTPSSVIPAAVLREIAAQGGIFTLTVTPREPAITLLFGTSIEVREKKS
jgi:hypothetical protein